jgi:branched-chain amino acid aminotransferase
MATAYHDGKFVPKEKITIGVGDLGFNRGVTVFELTRVYNGVPFRLSDHLDRFYNSARTLDITSVPNANEMITVVKRLIEENKYPHSAIKFYMTAGECANKWTGFAECEQFTPHLMIMEDEVKPAHPEAPYGLENYQRGQKLKIVPIERELPSVKSINYMMGYVASRRDAGKSWDDVLYTHRDGYVTEGTRSNFFCVIDGVLCTARQGMLEGITRRVVLELAAKNKIAYVERDLMPADIARATEAFTTGSIAELVPAGQIDDHILPSTMDGPVFRQLRQLFTGYVKQSCKPA